MNDLHALAFRGVPAMLLLVAATIVAAAAPADAPVVADRRVDVDGHQIHYLETGTGPAVVLVHGLGADTRVWRLTLPALAAHFHVLALDQLGFGQSDKPQIPYRVGTLSDSLLGFLDRVGVSKASLVGHSLGGWVTARLAAAHPERVDRLVLVDSAGYGADPERLVLDYLAERDPAAAATLERMFGSMGEGDRRLIEALGMSYFARRLAREDGYAVAALAQSIFNGEDALGEEMKTLQVPTLVVWGRDDPIIPLRVGEVLAADIPGAQKLVLDRCGHRPPSACPTTFNSAVSQFLLRSRK
jgi:pimeloyl-ACP methyl ester carboxylesterase